MIVKGLFKAPGVMHRVVFLLYTDDDTLAGITVKELRTGGKHIVKVYMLVYGAVMDVELVAGMPATYIQEPDAGMQLPADAERLASRSAAYGLVSRAGIV
jgi:hypothetical protein